MSYFNPIITTPTADDVESLIAMHDQSWLDTYPDEKAGISREWVQQRINRYPHSEKIEKRLKMISQAEIDQNILIRIAKDKAGNVVGLIMPYRDRETQQVGAIYIDKAYYGTGLAQRLMAEIIAWADPKWPLELEVASYNERAKAFYRKHGFEEVAGSERLHEIIPVIKMIRKGEKQ